MIQAYLDHGDTDTAVFELFVRSLPARRGFLLAAGLHQALDFLENLTAIDGRRLDRGSRQPCARRSSRRIGG
jgi:nicotinic acid phosphoribosyltransferase